MLDEILAYAWYALLIIPAFFWFFLIREFNKREKVGFPSFAYAIFYLIPFVHYWISWSFINDLRETQIKLRVENPVPVFKTYFFKLALPHLCLLAGVHIFTLLGVAFILFLPALGDLIVTFAGAVPYIAFIWLAFGFKSLANTIKAIK